MVDVHEAQQRAHFLELVIDGAVGIEDEQAGEIRHVFREAPVFIDGGVIVQAVFHADFIVLLAVAGGDVDAAGAGVEGDERGEDEDAFPVD